MERKCVYCVYFLNTVPPPKVCATNNSLLLVLTVFKQDPIPSFLVDASALRSLLPSPSMKPFHVVCSRIATPLLPPFSRNGRAELLAAAVGR